MPFQAYRLPAALGSASGLWDRKLDALSPRFKNWLALRTFVTSMRSLSRGWHNSSAIVLAMAKNSRPVGINERVQHCVVFNLRAAPDEDDLLTLRKALSAPRNFCTRYCLLLDWSDLGAGDTARARPANRTLIKSVDGIERVAILHHRSLNSRAAYLAAHLRSTGVLVRSYRASDRDRALAWLNTPER